MRRIARTCPFDIFFFSVKSTEGVLAYILFGFISLYSGPMQTATTNALAIGINVAWPLFSFFSPCSVDCIHQYSHTHGHTPHTHKGTRTRGSMNQWQIDLIQKKRVVYAIFFVFVFLIIFVSSRWIRKTHSQPARHWTKIIENVCFLAKKFQWSVGDCLSATAVCFQGNKW